MKTREQVQWFAECMEERLRANDHKGGWENDEIETLASRCLDEIDEVYAAIGSKDRESIIKECADVANFVMMIADNLRGDKDPQ